MGVFSPGTVIWALQQTSGKGRRGRVWESDQSSLTFSLVWRCPEGSACCLLTITVALGFGTGVPGALSGAWTEGEVA